MDYDKVILATGADQALALLEKPTSIENTLLSPWKYNRSPVILHTDSSYFPDKNLWGLYTFLYTGSNNVFNTSMNGFVAEGVIGTQYPNFPIKEETIIVKKEFLTPIFDRNSVKTIGSLYKLNGEQNTYFCGSYFGYGLHEDAVRSAVEIANLLGVDFS